MTPKILVPSLLALFIAGCTTPGSSSSSSSGATDRISTAGAVRAAGDLVPGRLVTVSIPAPTEEATVRGSGALAYMKTIPVDQTAWSVTSNVVHRTMKGDPSTFTIAVDNPDHARVLVHALDPSSALPTVHLVDVATGLRLDMARDETNQPNVIRSVHGPRADRPEEVEDRTALPFPELTPLPRPAREPGLMGNVNHLRRLSFDRPFAGGLVRVEVPADMATAGIFVELQQPKSHITATVVADQVNHSFGDVAEITANLNYDNAPIKGGTVEGSIELPGHGTLPNLSFTSQGDGKWTAKVPLASADLKYVGTWGIHVRATGAVNGVPFERDTETAFGYYPAHSQMTAVGKPVIARGPDNLIDSVSFDVDVETLQDDRLSAKAILTYTAPDGKEHTLAEAQTGQLVRAGNGTITLTFDNAAIGLAKVDGPFHLRDLALVSQGWGHTQHRLGRALDIQTPHIAASEIRRPTEIPLQARDMLANGDLPQ